MYVLEKDLYKRCTKTLYTRNKKKRLVVVVVVVVHFGHRVVHLKNRVRSLRVLLKCRVQSSIESYLLQSILFVRLISLA